MPPFKRYCKKYRHDTWAVGGRMYGSKCRECHRIESRERMRRIRNTQPYITRMDIGEIPNLATVRNELGLTLIEMAEYSGVSKSHIHFIERGRRKASGRVKKLLVVGVATAKKERYASKRT